MRRLLLPALALALVLGSCAPEPPALTWSPLTPKAGSDVKLTGKRFPSERPLEIWLQGAPAGQAVTHVRGAEPWAVRIEARQADAAGGFELTYRLPADLGPITDAQGKPAGSLRIVPGQAYSWLVYYGDAPQPLERPLIIGN